MIGIGHVCHEFEDLADRVGGGVAALRLTVVRRRVGALRA
jgi:hypothetical protein